MVSPWRSSSRNTSHVAQRGTRFALAIKTRGASGCVAKTPTGFPDCTSNVSSSPSVRSVRQIASNAAQSRAALPVPPYPPRSWGPSAPPGSRFFITIPSPPSWTPRPGPARRHTGLLVAPSGPRPPARRGGEPAALRHERRGRDLRRHDPRLEARVPGQERRQPGGEIGVDDALEPPLGQPSERGEPDPDHVEREGDRLPVEIAPREHLAVEHERIVGPRVQLGRDQPLGEGQAFAHGADHLWRAAQ